ncbi:MAG: hypothetical protein ACLUE8_07855 [Lachnospiraceae bacterium]
MKKLLPILLVLMMLCSTAFAAGFEVPAEGYDGSEVTITFCTQQGTALQEVTANYIAEFNSALSQHSCPDTPRSRRLRRRARPDRDRHQRGRAAQRGVLLPRPRGPVQSGQGRADPR